MQKYFSDVSLQETHMTEMQKMASQIRPTLKEGQILMLDSGIDTLQKELSEVLNLADKVISETEINCNLWKDYLELLNKVMDVLKIPVPIEQPVTVMSLKSSIKRLSNHLQDCQKNQTLINELNDKARDLDRKASKASSELINRQLSNINSQWQEHLCQVENELSALTDILNQWEVYLEVDNNVIASLRGYELRLDNAVLAIDDEELKVSCTFLWSVIDILKITS